MLLRVLLSQLPLESLCDTPFYHLSNFPTLLESVAVHRSHLYTNNQAPPDRFPKLYRIGRFHAVLAHNLTLSVTPINPCRLPLIPRVEVASTYLRIPNHLDHYLGFSCARYGNYLSPAVVRDAPPLYLPHLPLNQLDTKTHLP